jgi:hypothetical protein
MLSKLGKEVVVGDEIGLLDELPTAPPRRVMEIKPDGDILLLTVAGTKEPLVLDPEAYVLLYERGEVLRHQVCNFEIDPRWDYQDIAREFETWRQRVSRLTTLEEEEVVERWRSRSQIDPSISGTLQLSARFWLQTIESGMDLLRTFARFWGFKITIHFTPLTKEERLRLDLPLSKQHTSEDKS